MEFEIVGLNTRSAARAITGAGVACNSRDYNHDTPSAWMAVPDGSLGGDMNTAEIVSPILLADRLNEARTVSRALLANGARVNTSTGFHVHMGAAQIGLRHPLGRLVVNYYTAHNIFAKMVAPSRSNSRWCKTLTLEQAQETADRLNNADYDFARADRYFSLNLHAVARHSTVEFRLHQGTLNGTKALAWVNFLTAMVNYSTEGYNLPADWYGLNSADSLAKLPDLLTLIRDYGLTDGTVDYLLRRADELGNRG
jgi:hypothetical protein